MRADLIQIPYDSGHRAARLGQGPLHLVETGLPGYLSDRGHELRRQVVEAEMEFPTENTATFRLARSIAAQVAAAREADRFPLVLAGNCSSCLGTVAGLGGGPVGVIWFDAHGDFNTPETTRSGFLDGMALAILTGRCWGAAAGGIPGFSAVSEASVILVGARDLDPEEERSLAGSNVALLPPRNLRDGAAKEILGSALDRLPPVVAEVYVHVDLDVLDPGEGRANAFAAPGGLRLEELLACIEAIAERRSVRAAALTAYDPAVDTGGRIREAAFDVAAGILRAAERE